MDTTAVVALAVLAWLFLPLPLAVACGRAFDFGSRSDELPERRQVGETATPESPRA